MKIGDQKVQRTLRKQKVRGLLQDKKVPGIKAGTRAAAAPGPPVWALQQDSWERARLTAPSAAKQGLSNTVRVSDFYPEKISFRMGRSDKVLPR